jgi:hypothetical protein
MHALGVRRDGKAAVEAQVSAESWRGGRRRLCELRVRRWFGALHGVTCQCQSRAPTKAKMCRRRGAHPPPVSLRLPPPLPPAGRQEGGRTFPRKRLVLGLTSLRHGPAPPAPSCACGWQEVGVCASSPRMRQVRGRMTTDLAQGRSAPPLPTSGREGGWQRRTPLTGGGCTFRRLRISSCFLLFVLSVIRLNTSPVAHLVGSLRGSRSLDAASPERL